MNVLALRMRSVVNEDEFLMLTAWMITFARGRILVEKYCMLSLRMRSVAKEDEFLTGRMRSLTRVDDSLHK